jgi:hypothetical protein
VNRKPDGGVSGAALCAFEPSRQAGHRFDIAKANFADPVTEIDLE